jgi:hypothetical protein
MSYTTNQNSSNSSSFIEAQQYSKFMLENLHDGFLPDNMFRNVSDFGNGTTLNIKTVGTVALQEVSESTPLVYNPIDTGNVQMVINNYVGDAWAISDILRQDGSDIESLLASRAMESTRAFQEDAETRFLETCNNAQTAGDTNTINGFAHRAIATGSNKTLALADIVAMGLAFDKANVPAAGRVLLVDPVTAAVMSLHFTATYASNSNPKFVSMLETSFANEGRFVTNLFGFDIYTSNRLPALTATEAVSGGNAVAGDKANIAMCITDDNCKPIMYASRQSPMAESERNKDLRQDEFIVTARDGFGVQRLDTLYVLFTDPTATS